jgi:alkylated DNA repair dioxygenase AlkB
MNIVDMHEHPSIKGLYLARFEGELCDVDTLVSETPWEHEQSIRATAQFGYSYNFKQRRCTVGKDLPEMFFHHNMLAVEAMKLLGRNTTFNQCLVNKYERGQSISPHIDAPVFDDAIAVICHGFGVMRFVMRTQGLDIKVPVPDNSIYIMTGESRHLWTHSLLPVENRRISVTFRTFMT